MKSKFEVSMGYDLKRPNELGWNGTHSAIASEVSMGYDLKRPNERARPQQGETMSQKFQWATTSSALTNHFVWR